ncbi:NAD(P)H-dependent flavin oxidoreductase YrpB (nitropropane dioxygenase family) [Nocardiopsis mwathae]|uniref:NAD(P)H-dependent flavin oxidoreductase YrpB (Nitropropane dioxygenase family) n=1 Tax=Nocardiopsis mwathae TaxID=1472723 RepID=A0A7W9YDX6_9ACTN|nr:nitronate monooxygenase family protein [Nocardiopsis mwathae]MBB6170205.1 NAD(P)H-dependent flavin oxidoreductase YrpB (nitropropane dioxygenase family) [Nocardiopsis mwathae]
MRTRATEMFGIELPIFAFSHCRDVVAAVSRAGGMGVLGALYFTPEELERELTWIDAHTGGRPYGVDVVMPAAYTGADLGAADGDGLRERLAAFIPDGHRHFVDELLARHGVPELTHDDTAHLLLGWTDATARPQVEVALGHPIGLLANALGAPPADVVERAHASGVPVAGIAGSVRHARKQREVGVDVIVAQGTEAGGHTGDVATMVLVPEIADAVAPAPVLAAGGIGRGRQMAAGMALGAEGVWTGSVWLATEEADTPPAALAQILAATSRDTVRSRSMTGKPARMLRNDWTEAWEGEDSPGPLPMPLQFMLIADALRRVGRVGHPTLTPSPVGQIVGGLNRVKPVSQVVYELMAEFGDTLERLNAATADDRTGRQIGESAGESAGRQGAG